MYTHKPKNKRISFYITYSECFGEICFRRILFLFVCKLCLFVCEFMSLCARIYFYQYRNTKYVHAFLCVHTYIHTYIHAYIHTYIQLTTSAAMFVDKEEGMLYSVSPQQVRYVVHMHALSFTPIFENKCAVFVRSRTFLS